MRPVNKISIQPTRNNVDKATPVSIGKRIAQLRVQNNWTQQTLASRLAMSRVAVSHIEMDLNLPSERTVTLLAGLFKLKPFELVGGTTYPKAKAERLPESVCCFTRLEMDFALMQNDLDWLIKLKGSPRVEKLQKTIIKKWSRRLKTWADGELSETEKGVIGAALDELMMIS